MIITYFAQYKAIQYSELRILSALRNPNYDLFNLRNDFSEFFKDEFCVTADYSILQVMDTFNKGETCKSSQCNFLCRWFTCKNEFLIEEVAALQSYLNSLDNNYFKSCFELKVEAITNSNISNEVFDYLREYIEN